MIWRATKCTFGCPATENPKWWAGSQVMCVWSGAKFTTIKYHVSWIHTNLLFAYSDVRINFIVLFVCYFKSNLTGMTTCIGVWSFKMRLTLFVTWLVIIVLSLLYLSLSLRWGFTFFFDFQRSNPWLEANKTSWQGHSFQTSPKQNKTHSFILQY